MNFFGHSVVARLKSAEPGFVLGAMLPDFATMIAARPPSSSHDAVGPGIDFHHATDDVFHRAKTFLDLQKGAFESLRYRGVNRGGARAVAHIGVELLLDAHLAHDPGARDGYESAIREGEPSSLGKFIDWNHATDEARYAELRDRLEQYGVHPGTDAPALAARLARILAGRPRLAIDAREQQLVRAWIEDTEEEVVERAETLMREVRYGLGLGD